MAEITIHVGGRAYPMSCRDGEEPRLIALAAIVDQQVSKAKQAAPGLTENRLLLFAGIFLADALNEAREELRDAQPVAPELNLLPTESAVDPGIAKALDSLATRMELVAQRLAATPAST